MIEGFRFTVDPKENNQVMPMNRRMFFRHSMVECLPTRLNSAGGSTSQQEDRMILEMLIRQNEVKEKLVKIMQKLYAVRVFVLHTFIHFIELNEKHRSPKMARTPTLTACP